MNVLIFHNVNTREGNKIMLGYLVFIWHGQEIKLNILNIFSIYPGY